MEGFVFISGKKCDTGTVGPALQRGVYLRLEKPSTVAGFICGLFDISYEKMCREIKTVMLNNSVLDDLENARLYPGETLVLSGAMPGLVGAMLRSGSPLKSMREGATAEERFEPVPGGGQPKEDSAALQAEAFVRLKLFNTVIKRFGDKLLRHGFYIEAERLQE